MEETLSRRSALIIIILSFAWNMIVVILFLCLQDDIHMSSPLIVTVENERQKEKNEEFIYLADRLISFGSSQFSTTILPQEKPEEQLQQQKVQPSDMAIKIEPAIQQTLQSQTQKLEEAPTHEELEQTNDKENVTKKEHSAEECKGPPEQPLEQPQLDQTFMEQKTTVIQEDLQKTESQPLEELKQNSAQKQPKKPPLFKSTAKKSESPKKKTISLADIAKGYMQKIVYDREHNVETQLRSLPTSKQMALQVYSTKIFGLLEQAAKVNQKMLYAPENHTTDAALMLTIDRDGKLLEAHLIPQLHEKEIREWLFNFVKQVGLFPPIPKHLKKDKITLHYPLKINIHQGFGTYSLYYGFGNRY